MSRAAKAALSARIIPMRRRVTVDLPNFSVPKLECRTAAAACAGMDTSRQRPTGCLQLDQAPFKRRDSLSRAPGAASVGPMMLQRRRIPLLPDALTSVVSPPPLPSNSRTSIKGIHDPPDKLFGLPIPRRRPIRVQPRIRIWRISPSIAPGSPPAYSLSELAFHSLTYIRQQMSAS